MRKLQEIIGGKDEIADLEDRLAKARAKAATIEAELDQLAAQRELAEDFEAAQAIDKKIERLKFDSGRARRTIDDLNAKFADARARRARERFAFFSRETARLFPKLRSALEAALEVQLEAIRLREAAAAELGESAIVTIPVIIYRGLMMPELVEMWRKEIDRQLANTTAAPRSRPAPAPRPARPLQPGAAAHPPLNGTRSAPLEKRVRKPLPQIEGGMRVVALKNGLEINGERLVAGDVAVMRPDQAEQAMRAGNVDLAPDLAPTAQEKA